MVGVTLHSGYIHLASNPSGQLMLRYKKVDGKSSGRARVVQLAGGVRKNVRWPGAEPEVDIDAPYVQIETARTLESWVGQVVVWRDLQGRVVWGQLDEVDYDWSPSYPDNRVSTLSLTIITTSQTAAV